MSVGGDIGAAQAAAHRGAMLPCMQGPLLAEVITTTPGQKEMTWPQGNLAPLRPLLEGPGNRPRKGNPAGVGVP
eukprot:scaffold169604_cov31-Prasinocladus_malaysianus.AAC.1